MYLLIIHCCTTLNINEKCENTRVEHSNTTEREKLNK